jgi:hypothetical protein
MKKYPTLKRECEEVIYLCHATILQMKQFYETLRK